ncbi:MULTISPECIES: hypothetical protein [Bacillus amyloliquefaciens group]|uniref:hypothetical protein n=1 Tax=Bacillus amyloliquefaciens group TaxID=1938374 RepID=UPI0018EA5F8A|nr:MULTISPECIES: hypothetical protein [Bacillus amyloliquefaciens group]MCW8785808.1 hypothetical protein [Bacillus velezensis]QPV79328.1 hypothetical protein I8N73_09280 [Bacillus velezensis]UNE51092.1 hypothetical protein F5K02_09600 [Bacillus amyloliquefaciens]
MATRLQKALTEVGNHTTGNLNSLKIKTVAHGAKVTGSDIDNFMLVELGFDAEGNRTAAKLSDKTKKAYLIASPEARYLGESMRDFYNGVGEHARIVILEPAYTRFDVSAFSLNVGVTDVKQGQVAHFDIATQKYILSDPASPHEDYADSSAKFLVVNNEDDLVYTMGQKLVRLEVIEA